MSPKKDLESDIDLLLAPLAAKYSAFYAFYRLDSTNSLGHEFILYSYINDQTASVRDKMLYASTLSTIKVKFLKRLAKCSISVFIRRLSVEVI